MLPVLKRKMAEWEAKRKAKPLIQRWLHMMVRRGQYRRLQQKAIWWQARRRGTLARRRVSALSRCAWRVARGTRKKYNKLYAYFTFLTVMK